MEAGRWADELCQLGCERIAGTGLQVSRKLGVSNGHVRNMAVWGEHGGTPGGRGPGGGRGETSSSSSSSSSGRLHVDARHADVLQVGQWTSLRGALHDDRWLRHDLVQVTPSVTSCPTWGSWGGSRNLR